MERALLIIAPVNFRDEEFFETKAILDKAGIQVTVAGKTTAIAKGKLGGTVKPDIALASVRIPDYDAVAFIGGSGAAVYFDDPQAHRIAKEAIEHHKLLAAICIAPAILARAGVLKGVKATVFPDDAAELTANGAEYTGKPVEKDGMIITGAGPEAAAEFGRAIADHLTRKD
ncbi:MAG: DJ-1/PfpI family protein [Candidatus Omnitrophota bacterium]